MLHTQVSRHVGRRAAVAAASSQTTVICCSLLSQRHQYSTLSSALKLSSLPAPHAGSISVVSLNRPRARNAISRQLLQELGQVVDGLHRQGPEGSTRALIIASESDDSFCAGADLKERHGMTPEEWEKSKLSWTRLAIIPGGGGTYRLPALIGVNRARDMILTGRRVAGPEAYFLGLCDRLVEVTEDEAQQPGTSREKVLAAAATLARDICEGGPVATRAALEAVNSWTLGETAENRAYETVMPTEDRLEALKAFREKRVPVFKGR